MSKISYLKGTLIVIFALTVIIVGYTGWKSFNTSSKLKNSDSVSVDIQGTPIEQKTANDKKTSEIDIPHWKTYRNTKYKFELKYPQGWFWSRIDEQRGSFAITDHDTSYEGDPQLLGRGGGFGAKIELSVLNVQILKEQGNFDDIFKCAESDIDTIVITCEDVVVNGITYKKQILKSAAEGPHYSISMRTEKNRYVYLVVGHVPIDEEQSLLKIRKIMESFVIN